MREVGGEGWGGGRVERDVGRDIEKVGCEREGEEERKEG